MTKALRRLVEFAAGPSQGSTPRPSETWSSTARQSRRFVFLDSGTLISLFYFWEACEQAQTEPGAITGSQDLMQALKAAGLDESLRKQTSRHQPRDPHVPCPNWPKQF